VHVRVDGTGGFGSTAVDTLRADLELRRKIPDFAVIEVHFSASPRDGTKYADIVTEMYAESAEALRGLRIERVPPELEGDLTERQYEFVNRAGVTVRKLEEKEKYRRRAVPRRSPDDGDGFVLCASPDTLFRRISAAYVAAGDTTPGQRRYQPR
jgi:hypothetical protein